jgi:hypothetical protein
MGYRGDRIGGAVTSQHLRATSAFLVLSTASTAGPACLACPFSSPTQMAASWPRGGSRSQTCRMPDDQHCNVSCLQSPDRLRRRNCPVGTKSTAMPAPTAYPLDLCGTSCSLVSAPSRLKIRPLPTCRSCGFGGQVALSVAKALSGA